MPKQQQQQPKRPPCMVFESPYHENEFRLQPLELFMNLQLLNLCSCSGSYMPFVGIALITGYSEPTIKTFIMIWIVVIPKV